MLLWDTIKMRIRSSSLKYAKEKKAKMKSKETNLECDSLSSRRNWKETTFLKPIKLTRLMNERSKHSSERKFACIKPEGQSYDLRRAGIMKERKIPNTF